MLNSVDSSTKAIAGKDGNYEKLEKGPPPLHPYSELRRSPGYVTFTGLLGSGNISHLDNVFFKLGERGSGTRPVATVQDYDVLRDECLKEDKLFEDPEFPAQPSSMYGSKRVEKVLEWTRPGDMVKDPQFFVNGHSRFDVKQGKNFSDCWLLAATANLAMHKKLFDRVVPKDQSFQEKYAGIFHFRFWQYGKWVDVVIDDRLPIYHDEDGNKKLLGLHSGVNNEFWSSLLEKAYAKLYGSYAALNIGFSGDAIEDFTGGVVQRYHTDSTPSNLFDVLLKAYKNNPLMACVFQKNEKTQSKGLIDSHAYSITHVTYVYNGTKDQEKIPLLRIRNPWGSAKEWRGAWSDNSSEWKSISKQEKKRVGFESAVDGEFWMCFQDFKYHLKTLDISYLKMDTFLDEPDEDANLMKWHMSMFEGEWVRGVTAGGSIKDLEKFQYNPQYHITFAEESRVIIALMQKHPRIRGPTGLRYLKIGLSLIPLNEDFSENSPKPLDLEFFKNIDIEQVNAKSSYYRQVILDKTAHSGSYCIIPSTYDPDKDGEFLLRIYSEKPHKIEEYHEQVGIDEVDYTEIDEPEIEKFRKFFRQLSGDDWELDWIEQNKLLDFEMYKELHNQGFSKESCRSIVAMLDTDRSGKLSFSEFKKFWYDVKELRRVFKKITATADDDEVVGYLNTFDVRKALNDAGYHVNIRMLGSIVRRYGTEDHKITLEDFIICALRIKTMIGIFKEWENCKTNTASITREDWLDMTMYL